MRQQLVEKYKPDTIDAFAGLAGPRAIISAFAADPYEAAFLFLGPSGLGKTTMALALAEAINGEVHHVPSRSCDLATVEALVHSCWYVPMAAKWHVPIIDECDQMTRAAQLSFLSKLDTTAAPPKTVFVFSANATDLLESRFLSRCRIVKFTTDDMLEPAAALLKRIWAAEAPRRAEPDFRAMIRDAGFNVRSAIMTLEMELLASGSFVAEKSHEVIAMPRVTRSVKRANVPAVTMPAGDVLDAYQAAALLKINVATVYNRIKQGRIPRPYQTRPMAWQRSQIEACA